MLLFEVLLVSDYWLDGQHGAARLPQRLGVVVDVRRRGDPVVVRNGPDHALETHRVDFDVEVCLASRLDLHIMYYVHIVHIGLISVRGKATNFFLYFHQWWLSLQPHPGIKKNAGEILCP